MIAATANLVLGRGCNRARRLGPPASPAAARGRRRSPGRRAGGRSPPGGDGGNRARGRVGAGVRGALDPAARVDARRVDLHLYLRDAARIPGRHRGRWAESAGRWPTGGGGRSSRTSSSWFRRSRSGSRSISLPPDVPLPELAVLVRPGVRSAQRGGSPRQAVWIVSLVIAGLIMTPPAVLMGMHFPVAVRAAIGSTRRTARGPSGRLRCEHARWRVRGVRRGVRLVADNRPAVDDLVGRDSRARGGGMLVVFALRGTRKTLVYAGPLGAGPACSCSRRSRPPWDSRDVDDRGDVPLRASRFEDHSAQGDVRLLGRAVPTSCSTRRACRRWSRSPEPRDRRHVARADGKVDRVDERPTLIQVLCRRAAAVRAGPGRRDDRRARERGHGGR